MIPFRPVPIARRLGQAAPPTLPPAPSGVPTAPSAITAPVPGPDFLTVLKWGVIGFVAGGATGYALGRLSGSKGGGMMDSLLGGVGGVVASVLPRLLGLS